VVLALKTTSAPAVIAMILVLTTVFSLNLNLFAQDIFLAYLKFTNALTIIVILLRKNVLQAVLSMVFASFRILILV
jgi:hypothetical protein